VRLIRTVDTTGQSIIPSPLVEAIMPFIVSNQRVAEATSPGNNKGVVGDFVLLRFDAEDSAVVLNANWKVFDRNDKQLAGGRFSPLVNIADYDGLVAARSQSRGGLAQAIGDGIAVKRAR
jgi:hypothetical protein